MQSCASLIGCSIECHLQNIPGVGRHSEGPVWDHVGRIQRETREIHVALGSRTRSAWQIVNDGRLSWTTQSIMSWHWRRAWHTDDREQTENWLCRLHRLSTQCRGDLWEACGMHRPSYALPDHIQADPGPLGTVVLISSGFDCWCNTP